MKQKQLFKLIRKLIETIDFYDCEKLFVEIYGNTHFV